MKNLILLLMIVLGTIATAQPVGLLGTSQSNCIQWLESHHEYNYQANEVSVKGVTTLTYGYANDDKLEVLFFFKNRVCLSICVLLPEDMYRDYMSTVLKDHNVQENGYGRWINRYDGYNITVYKEGRYRKVMFLSN